MLSFASYTGLSNCLIIFTSRLSYIGLSMGSRTVTALLPDIVLSLCFFPFLSDFKASLVNFKSGLAAFGGLFFSLVFSTEDLGVAPVAPEGDAVAGALSEVDAVIGTLGEVDSLVNFRSGLAAFGGFFFSLVFSTEGLDDAVASAASKVDAVAGTSSEVANFRSGLAASVGFFFSLVFSTEGLDDAVASTASEVDAVTGTSSEFVNFRSGLAASVGFFFSLVFSTEVLDADAVASEVDAVAVTASEVDDEVVESFCWEVVASLFGDCPSFGLIVRGFVTGFCFGVACSCPVALAVSVSAVVLEAGFMGTVGASLIGCGVLGAGLRGVADADLASFDEAEILDTGFRGTFGACLVAAASDPGSNDAGGLGAGFRGRFVIAGAALGASIGVLGAGFSGCLVATVLAGSNKVMAAGIVFRGCCVVAGDLAGSDGVVVARSVGIRGISGAFLAGSDFTSSVEGTDFGRVYDDVNSFVFLVAFSSASSEIPALLASMYCGLSRHETRMLLIL